MTTKRFLMIGLVAAGFAASGPALAQLKLSGFYIGGGGGQTRADIDTGSIDADIRTIPGITSSVTTSDERDTGWKLYAGYQFHPNFAAELSYANLGKFSTLTRTNLPAPVNGEIKVDNTWSADILGIWPLGNNFSIFGRLGLLYSETKVSASANFPAPVGRIAVSDKDSDWNWKAGLGVGYEFTPNVGVRGEWERYRVSDGSGGSGDIDLWSISVRFKF